MARKVEKGYEFGGFKLGQKVMCNGVKREIIAFDEGESIWKVGLKGKNECDFEGLIESVKYYRKSNIEWARLIDVKPIKEPTLIEKIADHFGVAIGEEFNVFWVGDQKILKDGSPYKFNNEFICNSYDNWDYPAMNRIICGDLLIEKIPVKSAKDLAIEEAEKNLKEAQEALKKAKEME